MRQEARNTSRLLWLMEQYCCSAKDLWIVEADDCVAGAIVISGLNAVRQSVTLDEHASRAFVRYGRGFRIADYGETEEAK